MTCCCEQLRLVTERLEALADRLELKAEPREPQYLTVDEVAELLRTSPETVRYWRHVGKGPRSIKKGRRVLYARADVEAYMSEIT